MRWIRCTLLALAAAFPWIAYADYPEKTVQYIVAFTAGGESDVAARLQAEIFKKKYKHDMVVINKPGAGGGLVWSQLNSLPADGYTIVGVNVPHIILQPFEGNVRYKTEDIASVYFFHYTPDVIAVAEDSPYKTFQDLINAAKAKPGTLNFAGSGSYSANHMAHERLDKLAGIKTTYLPFKGTGDLVASVLGKHVDAAMTYLPLAVAQKGKMRMLAVASEKRHPAFPDAPTFKELGFDWVGGAYRGVAVPNKTPKDIQKRISDIFHDINQDPELRKRMAEGGFEVVDIPLDKIPEFMAEQTKAAVADAKLAGLLK